MKNVLIVDDERFFLMSLVEGLGTYAADFNTLTAENGKKALAVLRSTLIDLVITDLKMPEMDGFELLAHMNKEFLDIPVVVMTAYATPEIKSRLEELGSFHLLEKPIDFRELVDTIFTQLSSISKGYIRGITLPAFLQLVEMEKKTCTLKVMSKGRIGYLYFFEGTLVDANNGKETAEDAAYDIVCWDEAEIEISNTCRDKTRMITSTLGHVLMDGFRIKDEKLHKQELSQSAEHIALGDDFSSLLKSIEGTEEGGKDYKSESETKEEKMASLKEILKEFTKLQGVNAVCLVGRDGFLLDSIAHTGIDTEMIGAIASSGFGASESMGRQLGKGAMAMSMIEFENGPVMFSPVGDDAFIVVIADKDSNLGMVRLKLKKHSHELATAAAI
jgi:predicted regulator of Ras-like GTPase activity (Roadblock/LC7/MglB family)/ActR/RegA family two-component response regulator